MQVKYLMSFRKNRLTSDEKSSIWKYERDRKTRRTDFPSRIGPPLRGGNRPGIGERMRALAIAKAQRVLTSKKNVEPKKPAA